MDLPTISDLISDIFGFANTNFSTALFGAFAGAYGGQWIVERSNRRKALLNEIRSTNAAIMVAFGICNICMALKRQHVRPLKETFDKQRGELEEFNTARSRRLIPLDHPFEFQANLQTFEPLLLPIEMLQGLTFEKISLGPRPLSTVTTLSQSANSLSKMIERRNLLIEQHRSTRPMEPHLYFGMEDEDGHVDYSYPSCIEGIYTLTDDCIFFSHLLCEDLISHGGSIKEQYGRSGPTIRKLDFSGATENNLLPNPELYSDWTKAFASLSSTTIRSG